MSIKLVTGYAGVGHVTSADAGKFNAGICGTEKYVLDTAERFACTIESNNLLRIASGDLIDQGRHISITQNSTESVAIENGTQNQTRIDVIVARYEKDASTGIESASIVVLKGTEVASGSTPIPAMHQSGNIYNGDLIDDVPLYEVTINNLQITSVTQVFEVLTPLSGMLNKVYPVGSIYLSVNNINPSNYFGGTWIQWGAGRVPVGVDQSQEEFKTTEKTGGNKNLQEHNHTGPEHAHTFSGSANHSHKPSDSSYTFSTYKGSRSSDNVGAISGTGYKMVRVDATGAWSGSSRTSTETVNISGSTEKAGTESTGKAGTGNSGNLQPYITCYMWKRTA